MSTFHVIVMYGPAIKYAYLMYHICHMCQSVHIHIWHKYVSIYISHELISISNVTRNTGIHTFHITGTCSWTNIPATLYIYIPLHFNCPQHIHPTLLLISIKKSICCNIYTLYYCKICANNKNALQMPTVCHMPKLLNVHLWSMYASTSVWYEVSPISDVARITVHRCWWWQQ